MKQYIYIAIILCLFQSCDYFRSTEEEEAIARVNDVYLFNEDLKKLIAIDPDDTFVPKQNK